MFFQPRLHSETPYYWRLIYLTIGIVQLTTGALLFLTTRNHLILALGTLSLFGAWIFLNSLRPNKSGSDFVALGFTICLGLITGGSNNPLWVLSFLPLLSEGVRQSFLRSSLFLLLTFAGWLLTHLSLLNNPINLTNNETLKIQALSELIVILLFFCIGRILAHEREHTQKNWNKNKQVQNQKDKITSQQTLIAALLHKMATPLNVALLELERATPQKPELDSALQALEEAEQYLRQINLSLEQNRHTSQEKLIAEKAIPLWLKELGYSTDASNLFIEKNTEWTGDLENLKEALAVLLQNAREASAPFGVEPELRVFTHDKDLVIQVIDRGPGFLENILKHWGEPYNSSKGSHRGMGLYHVHLFAQAHGGDLSAENLNGRPNTGARVTLRLPESLEVLL